MAIFKGFKQVTAEKFNAAKDANELVGYLWFVRTEVPETEGENDVNNDSYDIYFGSKKYGHFQAGEIEGIKSSIEELNGDVESILKTLETLTSAVETNTTAIAKNKAAHEKNATDIAGIQKSLTSFLVKDVDANDKVLTVADGILSSQISLTYENNRGVKKISFGLNSLRQGTFPETHYYDTQVGVPANRELNCLADLSWTEEKKILLRVYITDTNLGSCFMTFGFKNDEVGVMLNKRAEFFMEDYVGYAGGKRR